YATVLGFQARGAPDPTQIAAFANQSAPIVGPLGLLILTFVGAVWLARRPKVTGPVNGLALGILVGAVSLFSRSLGIIAIALALLVVLAGWLGGSLGRRTASG